MVAEGSDQAHVPPQVLSIFKPSSVHEVLHITSATYSNCQPHSIVIQVHRTMRSVNASF